MRDSRGALRAPDAPKREPRREQNTKQIEQATEQTIEQAAEQQEAQQYAVDEMLLRLLVGAVLEGSDEALRRLRVWDAATRDALAASGAAAHPLRSVLLGMLLETEEGVRGGIVSFGRLGARMWGRGRRALRRVTDETLPVGMLLRLDALVERGQNLRDRWMLEGFLIERQGRSLARRATNDAVAELLGYFARDPQVRSLIEQQSLGMAGAAVEDVRSRAASADAWVEQMTQALLRRGPRPGTSAPAKEGSQEKPQEKSSEAPKSPTRPNRGGS